MHNFLLDPLSYIAGDHNPSLPHQRLHEIQDTPGAPRNSEPQRSGQLKVSSLVSSKDPWAIWERWVKPDYLYPEEAFYSEEMNHILAVMATSPITSFGVGHRGTQLKATAMLGAQRTVFKPKR